MIRTDVLPTACRTAYFDPEHFSLHLCYASFRSGFERTVSC